MNERVKEYLDAKGRERIERYKKEKNETLCTLGLFEKEYSPNNEWSEEYCLNEWDSDLEQTRYYKNAPIEVTDEEYEEILKFSKDEGGNVIAKVLTCIAWIVFVGGFLVGIALGNVEVEGYYSYHKEFSFAIAFGYWCTSFISGMVFLGFAEIIKLLNDIKNK